MIQDSIHFTEGMILGRLDERLASPARRNAMKGWLLRREAIRIAAREGHGTDEIRFAGFNAKTSDGIADPALRAASDISKALEMVLAWPSAGVTEADVRSVWEASNRSTPTRENGERQWRLDTAFGETAATLDIMLTEPSPEKTAKAFIDIYDNPNFGRQSTRMAYMLVPHLVRIGLRAPHALMGIAQHLEIERAQPGIHDPTLMVRDDLHLMLPKIMEAIGMGAETAYQASLKMGRITKELVAAVPRKRSSPNLENTVAVMLRTPVINPTLLASTIGMTIKGATLVLDALEQSGCISRLNADSPRSRTYVCHKALNL